VTDERMTVDAIGKILRIEGVLKFARARPRLAGWLILSAAMCTFLVFEGRDVALAAGQWLVLLAACVAVAGVCVWIVAGGEDEGTDRRSSREEEPSP
jgi:hypothetical protein